MASYDDDDQDESDFQSHSDDYGQSSKCSRILLYLQIYFVTIATILGTGILGLPVTLSRSGMGPFTAAFIIGFLMQALLIYDFTILLQKAFAVKNMYGVMEEKDEGFPLHPVPIASQDNQDENEDFVTGKVIQPLDLSERTYPNLHMMGEIFLPCGIRQLFDLCSLLLFVSLLISYALAGSEAYAEIIGVRHILVIPFFCWICTLLIIFAQRIIQPLVSVLTLAKGGLLIGTVFVTFYVGTQIQQDSHTKWRYIGSPFLMGTVAIGGIINVMPMLFSKMEQSRSQIKYFLNCILAGLITCVILNIAWCYSILSIVPQRCSDLQDSDLLYNDTNGNAHCNVSLAWSKRNGEISTIPLTRIIRTDYATYNWVAWLVEFFIMISITVSFLTIGSAYRHMLEGIMDAFMTTGSSAFSFRIYKGYGQFVNRKCVTEFIVYFSAFGLIFIVAMLDPRGFVTVLDKAASLLMNMQAGIFVTLMLHKSQNGSFKNLPIPIKMNTILYYCSYIMTFYFVFAVVYDIVITAAHAMNE